MAVEIGVALPVLAPVSGHGLPASFGPFDRDRTDVPCTRDVGDQNQIEVGVAVDCEPYSSFLHTRHPSEGYWDNSCSVLSDFEESRLGHVEVLERRVAPATVVVRQGQVGRAKVGGGHDDRAGEAPFRISTAPELVTGAAAQPIVEQRRAQSCSVRSITLTV